jgi:hypothetical protein
MSDYSDNELLDNIETVLVNMSDQLDTIIELLKKK